MREEWPCGVVWSVEDGITPAHAGRIFTRNGRCIFIQDHPRACGKNLSETWCKGKRVGSPPRMREEFAETDAPKFTQGITPAHAGRITLSYTQGSITLDHPRACGKNLGIACPPFVPVGSPPRMREEYDKSVLTFNKPRITPAHAGRMQKGVDYDYRI